MLVLSRRPAWAREAGGVALALLMTAIAVAHLVSSDRRVLLFSDGDSMLTALVAASVAVGQPQDWAMSSVLFVPELAVFGALSTLGRGLTVTLTINAFVNYLALYGAIRLVAGARAHASAPVAGSLLAFGAYCALSLLEGSPDRDALETASLLATTTYYSATVIAVVVTIGLIRRVADDGDRRLRSRIALVGAVAAASAFTNPIFLAWAVVPLGVVLAAWALMRRERRPVAILIALVAGSGLGMLARLPFADHIANTGAGYAQPARWLDSVAYYAQLLADRLSSLAGAVAVVAVMVLWVAALVASVAAGRGRRDAAAFVAATAWVVPVIVVVGAVALGTNAARYLAPAVFAPVLALTLVPAFAWEAMPRPASGRSGIGRVPRAGLRIAGVVAAVCLIAASALSAPRLAEGATRADPDLECVTDWIAASGRTGAGQFWTVRAAKARLDDPRRLVQVDHTLRGYAWLVNRDDFSVGEVSFLLLDDQSAPFELPGVVSIDDAELTMCGRFTIADFAPLRLPLGPQRS